MKAGYRIISLSLFALLFLVVAIGCHENSPAQVEKSQPDMRSPVSRDELISAIQSEKFDLVFRVLNRVKAMRYQGDLLPLIGDMWSGNRIKDMEVDPKFINKPMIRIEIADILIQASNNGQKTVKREDLADFVRKTISSDDVEVKIEAVRILGEVNDQRDVDTLTQIAFGEEDRVFQSAVAALSNNCWTSQALVDQILGRMRTLSHKEYFAQVWAGMQPIRFAVCPRLKEVVQK